MTTTLTGKNQVTVPAEIAREFKLEPGSKLDWSKGRKPGMIVVTVQPSKRQMLDRLQVIGRTFMEGDSKGRDLVAELIKEREEEMI
jgi:bifunctional DNA-binding transcriptional regulator/antitoxin component of YhaV-PrlF toxin-antitoxin module